MDSRNREPYVFWVWGKPKSLLRFHLLKCEIGTNFYVKDELNIPLDSITSAKLFVSGKGIKSLEIKYLSEIKKKYFSLTPVAPFNPYASSNYECEKMVNIITGLQKGEKVSIEKNPYLRAIPLLNEKTRKKFEETEFDPNTDPWIYYDQYHDKTPIGKTVLELTITLIVTSFIILLMAYLAGGFN